MAGSLNGLRLVNAPCRGGGRRWGREVDESSPAYAGLGVRPDRPRRFKWVIRRPLWTVMYPRSSARLIRMCIHAVM